MKFVKISLIVFALLSILLMTGVPVQAKVTRIDFYGTDDPETAFHNIEETRVSGPNMHLYGNCGVHVTTYDTNDNLLPQQTGWAYGTDVRLQIVDGHEIYNMKITKYPDVNEGGYWEGTFTTIPNSGGGSKVVLNGKGTYQGLHTEVTNFPDGTFVGFMTVK